MRHPSDIHICIAEDRPEMEPALRLLLQSLSSNAPGYRVHLFVPNPTQPLEDFVLSLRLRCTFEEISNFEPGYNIKPFALSQLVAQGCDQVLWIDSDIIVTPAIEGFLLRLTPGSIVICEEMLGRFHEDSGERTRDWGFSSGRVFPFALNSGVLKVDASHRLLIERWASLLATETYRSAQAKRWDERAAHLLGDQDVLTALLGSAEFVDVPVELLRRGPGIIQFSGPYGYTVSERVRHLVTGLPPFIHSLGHKPWLGAGSDGQLYERFSRLYQACSPYTLAARQYKDVLTAQDWLACRHPFERALRALGFGSVAFSGFPLAALADGVRLVKQVRSAVRRK